MDKVAKIKSPRNKTLTLSKEELEKYKANLYRFSGDLIDAKDIINQNICADIFEIVRYLPASFVDLLIIDPPYNQDKSFHGLSFTKKSDEGYFDYIMSWFQPLLQVLKPNGSIYMCGDWRSSSAIYRAMSSSLVVHNRITWQREKGRGAKANWKNCSEDIWFGTKSGEYYFDTEAVKQKRKVLAPYKSEGKPKDWEETADGKFRDTYPSNFWDDITIPYWSMAENTDHPTQKPEKLIAKLILASCPVGGIVLDPFAGSGTTAVVSTKLGRNFVGVEINEDYCCYAEKRLEKSLVDTRIQGYEDGIFWERNSVRGKILG